MAAMTLRALPCCLSALLALSGCKSDDKPKDPERMNVESTTEKASETVEKAREKAETAADKARSAMEAAKEKARAAGEVAVDRTADAITDAKQLREALSLLDGRIAKVSDQLQRATTEDARRSTTAVLEQLKQEKQRLEDRLAALRKDDK